MKTTFLFILILSISFCRAQKSKGDRILAWQVDMAENANYDSAVTYAENACMESLHLFYTWSGIEPGGGSFDQNYIGNVLDVGNIYYPAKGIKAELQLATMNTNQLEIPSDLITFAFDDSVVINRFKILLDTLFAHIPDIELTALNIGNESDIYMGADIAQYKAYKTFLDSVIPYAKSLYFNLHNKDLMVGTTFTLGGLTDVNRSALCKIVNANLDLIATTYYPLKPDFTMNAPGVVSKDFGELVSLYPDTSQPIYFVECGYASSTECNSSDTAQADFYTNVFEAWDLFADNIKYITVFKSTDWSFQQVKDLGIYYGISDTIFLEYLRTLGVRTWDNDGKNKMAYETILCELTRRNWCSTSCVWTGLEDVKPTGSMVVFPNPSSGQIQIEPGQEYRNVSVIIRNTSGQVLSEQKYISPASIKTSINGPAGIYFIQIFTGEGIMESFKVVKY